MSKKVSHLFKRFRPEHYALNLDPNQKKMTFTGTVTIIGQKVQRPSQRLTLHQNGLHVTGATITRHDRKGNQEFVVDRINHHKGFNEVRLHTKTLLYPGKYTVVLEFSGKITRPMNGIYPCFYTYKNKPNQLIATQFESHYAREAFPCIDEPEAKATFDLTITTPKDETVISNTPIQKQTTKGNLTTTRFETTPKMSTYLLAFIFGKLTYLEARTNNGTIVRTYATPDNTSFTEFALQTAVKCLEFFNDYFGIEYPLPKLDLVALPDFASGAMENWGCVTFREQAILVDPLNTSLSVKQYVAMVVAHELAHQWFGNLVTMRWWTDLWLNEGFASWIEYLATDSLFPDWRMWTQFIVDEQEPALRLDSLQHTHPIEVPINHPDEIHTIFDTISYNKGSSVIHMLQHYLGADSFREGLQYYLKKHAYDNTDTIDLWAALEHVSQKPVKDFMQAWTSQSGYPLMSATVSKQELSLQQKRFHLSPKAVTKPALWPIPLQATTNLPRTVFDTSQVTFKFSDSQDNFLLNHERSGFYRVAYGSQHLLKLGNLVRDDKLSELDRLSLLSDTFEAAKAGNTSAIDALKLLESYRDETSSVVWDIMVSMLTTIRGVMDNEQLREAMKPFVRTLVAKQLKRLGWARKVNEPHFDTLLRPTILSMAAVSDEPGTVREALKRFKAAKKSEDIDPDLRGIVYGTAARLGDKAVFAKLLALHNASTSSEEKVTLAAALTGFKQPELVDHALSLIDTDTVRLQDVTYWVAYSFMNRYAKQSTWKWMIDHWTWLEQNLGSDLSFYRFPNYAANAFSDAAFLKSFKAFFEQHMKPALIRPVAQGIETIEWKAAWRARDFKSLQAYFKS